MNHTCFYCKDEIEEGNLHEVTFFASNAEREEKLCEECYQEWLQGVKG